MPLRDLPEYIKSIRESGQTDYVPVVDMGRIIDAGPSGGWINKFAYAAAALFLVSAGTLTYAVATTRSITITGGDDISSQAIANMVAESGGRVFSTRQNTDGTHEIRVFTFGKIDSFLEQLRENKDLKRVELRK